MSKSPWGAVPLGFYGYIYIYICVCVCNMYVYMYMCMYMYIERERDIYIYMVRCHHSSRGSDIRTGDVYHCYTHQSHPGHP